MDTSYAWAVFLFSLLATYATWESFEATSRSNRKFPWFLVIWLLFAQLGVLSYL